MGRRLSAVGWLTQLKKTISEAQQRVVLQVNRELVLLFWELGHDILERQKKNGWGAKVIEKLAHVLSEAFPDMKGFSARNLKYMRKFADTWSNKKFVQLVVAQIPWGHNLVLLERCKSNDERKGYIQLIVENGWSRNALVHHIELGTLQRFGKSQNNFDTTLRPSQSDLIRESLKDPYKFDFLSLGKKCTGTRN